MSKSTSMQYRAGSSGSDYRYSRQSSNQASSFYKSKSGSGFLKHRSHQDETMKHLGFDTGHFALGNIIERIKMTERDGASVMRDASAFSISSQL